MKEASHKTKVTLGIFVLASVVLGALLLIFTGREFTFFRGTVRFYTTFTSIEGLNRGAPIKLGGVDIGHVGDTTLVTHDDQSKVKVELLIIRPNEKLVKSDSIVLIRTQGVLGDKFLTLTPGSTPAEPAKPNEYLISRESEGLAGIMNKGTDLLESIEHISHTLSSAVKKLQESNQLGRIIDNVDKASESVKEITAKLDSDQSLLHYVSDKKSQASLKSTLDNLNKTSNHLLSSVRKIDEGKGTLGALINDTSVYDDLKSLLGGANRNKTLKYFIRKALESSKESEDGGANK